MAHEELGLILLKTEGKDAEAGEHCSVAIELNPDLEDAKACLTTLAARGVGTGILTGK